MFGNKKFKYQYVSEIDQFLQELNNAKSNSRIEEEQKYQRVFALRDAPQAASTQELPWKDF